MKLALCIPCYGDTKSKFTQSLATMIAHTLSVDLRDAEGEKITVQIETFMVSSSMLTESRHRLVAEALAWGADYMMWLDADHVFPHDTFCRLWAHGLPVVGANYPRRATPTAPTAAYDDDSGLPKLLYTTRELAEAGSVEACLHMGFGICLMHMAIFDKLQAKAEEEGDGNFLPLFMFEPTADKVGMVGEDVYFFRKLRAAGIVPFIDHKLSWEVGHLSEVILTNAHALVQKDKWAAFRAARADKFADKAQELEQAAESEIVA
jgi:hypothetical protein